MRRAEREQMAVERYKLDRCCLKAFKRAVAQVDLAAISPTFGAEDKGPFRLAGFMDDLAHGDVARAVVNEVVTLPLTGNETVTEEFARSLAEGQLPPSVPFDRDRRASPRPGLRETPELGVLPAPNRVTALEQLLARAAGVAEAHTLCAVLLAGALIAVKRGDLVAVEKLLRDAHQADPEDERPEQELARLAFERSDVAAAASIIRRVGSTLPEFAEAFILSREEEVRNLYRGIGRNDRCPCGSDRGRHRSAVICRCWATTDDQSSVILPAATTPTAHPGPGPGVR